MKKPFWNFIVTICWQYLQSISSAYPQLDIPFNNSTHSQISANEERFHQINDHSDKLIKSIVTKDHSNEIGIDDTLRFDRDRSLRFGPPYSDENDHRFYSNSSRSYNHNFNTYDDDDKFYVQPRPSPDLYYISEKQRNRYGQRNFFPSVRTK